MPDLYDPTQDDVPESLTPDENGEFWVSGDRSAIYTLTPADALSSLLLPLTAAFRWRRHVWQGFGSWLRLDEEIWGRVGYLPKDQVGNPTGMPFYWAQLQQEAGGGRFEYTLAEPDAQVWKRIDLSMPPWHIAWTDVPLQFPTSYPKSTPGPFDLIASLGATSGGITYLTPYGHCTNYLMSYGGEESKWEGTEYYFHLNNVVNVTWYRTTTAVPRTGGLVTTLAGLALAVGLLTLQPTAGGRLPRKPV